MKLSLELKAATQFILQEESRAGKEAETSSMMAAVSSLATEHLRCASLTQRFGMVNTSRMMNGKYMEGNGHALMEQTYRHLFWKYRRKSRKITIQRVMSSQKAQSDELIHGNAEHFLRLRFLGPLTHSAN
jgi:hypothetical protein